MVLAVFFDYRNNLITCDVTAQQITPQTVGIAMESSAHLRLPVSFLTVRQVVEQGKCRTVMMIIHTAVAAVQPFCVSSAASSP